MSIKFCDVCRRFSRPPRVRCELCFRMLGRSCACAGPLRIGYRCYTQCQRPKAIWRDGVVHEVDQATYVAPGRVMIFMRCSAFGISHTFPMFHSRNTTQAVTCIKCIVSTVTP